MIRTRRPGLQTPFALSAFCVVLLTGGTAVAAIPPGSGSFQFVDERGNADKPITVWTHAPAKLRANSPIVFVMHGMGRNGSDYRDQWIEHAEKHNFLLIAPEFSAALYPEDAYNCGNMFDGKGRPVNPSQWTFTAIEHLFDHVKKLTGNTSPRYCIYGHSAGGQFVHRLVLFLPQARYQKAIAANPGWYTMPISKIDFPYGLKNTTVTNDTLKQSFANPFVVLLGDEDTNRDDANLRKSSEADAQGPHRFARGKKYFETAKRRAEGMPTPFAWKQRTVRGAGHSNKQMSKAAATALFAR